MDKYISREAVLNLIEHNDKVCHYADERYENVVYATTQTICKVVAEMPSADVQPINQWISVEDRLPDKFDYVLCYCKTTTGEGNEFMFGAYHNDTWWLKTCRTYATLEQPQMRVMYWMPLPEPPKDGEHND